MKKLLTFLPFLLLASRLSAAVSPSVGALLDTNGTLASPLSAKLTVTVDTFANLETAPRLTNATYVLRGYYSVGDAGGGELVWDATSTAATNSGTVIKPSDVVLGGRFLRQVIGPLTPEMFGATTGAGTDSTLAIQAAFTAAKVVGDGYLEPANRDVAFLNGRYVISSPITIYNGASIIGAGQGNTIISTTATNIDLFTFSFDATAGVNNTVSISDMSFLYSNGGASNTAAIRIEGGTCTPTIRNVTITGAYNAIRGGLWIGGVLDKVYVINPVSDGIFIGNQSTTTTLTSCYVAGSSTGNGIFLGGTYNKAVLCAADRNYLYGYHVGPDNGYASVGNSIQGGAELNRLGAAWLEQAAAITVKLLSYNETNALYGVYIDGGNGIHIDNLVTSCIHTNAKGLYASVWKTNLCGLWPYDVHVYGGQMDGFTNKIVPEDKTIIIGRDYSDSAGYGFGTIPTAPFHSKSTNTTQAIFDGNSGTSTNAALMTIYTSPFYAETWLTDQNNTAQTVTYGRSMAGDSVSEDFRIGSITANYPINHLTPFLAAAIGATNTVAINLSPSWVPTNVLLTIDGAHYLARATTPTNVSLENVDDLAGRSVAAVYWTNTALGVWVGGTRYFETFRAYSSDGSARIPGSLYVGSELQVTNESKFGAPVSIHTEYTPALNIGTNGPSIKIYSGTNSGSLVLTGDRTPTNAFGIGFQIPASPMRTNLIFSAYRDGVGWYELGSWNLASSNLTLLAGGTSILDLQTAASSGYIPFTIGGVLVGQFGYSQWQPGFVMLNAAGDAYNMTWYDDGKVTVRSNLTVNGDTISFPTTNTAPVDALNVKRWKSIVVEGTTYRIPLYE